MSMSDSEIEERIGAISRLALLKNAEFPKGSQHLYFEELKDIHVDALSAACARLSKAMTYGMPDAAQIRVVADQVLREAHEQGFRSNADKLLPPKPGSDNHPFLHCIFCDDDPAAWITCWCDGAGKQKSDTITELDRKVTKKFAFCGRDNPHGPHPFCERCKCHDAIWRQAIRGPRSTATEVPGGKRRSNNYQ